MALPAVRTLSDCISLEKTVWPYVPQLYDLSQQVVQTVTNPHGLKDLYVSTNPAISGFAFSLFLFPVFLIASEINRNYSQVDRFWSILPTVYNVHYAIYAHVVGLPAERVDAAAAVSILWSCRLTWNYWRKGGYNKGSEDYRWEVLRKYMAPPLFFVFNVVFISLIQSILLYSISLPTYVLLLTGRLDGGGIKGVDIVFSSLIVILIGISAVADQQQWEYQTAKQEYHRTAKVQAGFTQAELDCGFRTTGLWAYSRHPNFAAEQSIWLCLYLWSCQATTSLYNWTGIGALSYLILFQSSTWFTELITSGKYPDYAEYQRRVSMFVPGFTTGLKSDFLEEQVPKVAQVAKASGKKAR